MVVGKKISNRQASLLLWRLPSDQEITNRIDKFFFILKTAEFYYLIILVVRKMT